MVIVAIFKTCLLTMTGMTGVKINQHGSNHSG